MAVLVVGAETNFAALRPRLFGPRRVSPDTAKRVADALREANPGVDLDGLLPGTVLVVPDLDAVSLDAELSLGDGAGQAVTGLHDALVGALRGATDEALRRNAEDAAERGRLAEVLQSAAVRKAADGDPLIAAQLDRTSGLIAEEDALAESRSAAISEARDEWAAELDGLEGLMP